MYYQFKDDQLYAIPDSYDYYPIAIAVHLQRYKDSVSQIESLQQIFDKTRYLLAILWSIQNLAWDNHNLKTLNKLLSQKKIYNNVLMSRQRAAIIKFT